MSLSCDLWLAKEIDNMAWNMLLYSKGFRNDQDKEEYGKEISVHFIEEI